MFNLLVSGSGWAEGRDTMPSARAFEYTRDYLVDQLKPNGQLEITKLLAFPTLFVQETSGRGDQVARIGTITNARVSGREIVLEYAYDPLVPPFTNKALQGFAADLDIDDFQFYRTHWSVKDVDLFRVLFRNMQPRRQQPTVFNLADPEIIEPSLVAVMMPFSSGFDAVYETLKRTVEESGLRCRRVDEIWENPAIIQDIVSLIDRAKIVICDCTGRNPNVFYEIGIAHTLGREVVLITQFEADIPFDLRHLRYISYLNNGEGLNTLSERLQPRLADLAY